MPQQLVTDDQIKTFFEENPKATHAEAAARLGVSMGTISARMSRLSLRRELVLTDHDVAVFKFIINFIIENRWSPTVTEISDGVGCARSAAHNSLHRLSAYGAIEMGEGARTVRVIGSRVDMSEVTNVAR